MIFLRRADRERRLRIFETDYGREAGWYVEGHGRRIAVLTAPRREEMFWDSYRIEPMTEDPEEAQLLSAPAHWLDNEFVFRSREFGETAAYAFPAGEPICGDHRVLMRGLYLSISKPTVWERWLLWCRGSRRAAWNA
jgi:hypothetical protein